MSESLHKDWSLFTTFFKIGAFTLGGGYAMIPLVQREVVDNRKWIPAEEFLDLIALAQSAPGIIAVNTAVFVGYKIDGWRGLFAAVIGATLPSFCIILLIATCFTHFRDYPAVEAVFKGIRPAVVALIAAPLYKMGKSAKVSWKTIILPIAAALLIWLGKVSPVLIIVIAILGGLAFTWCQDQYNRKHLPSQPDKDKETNINEPADESAKTEEGSLSGNQSANDKETSENNLAEMSVKDTADSLSANEGKEEQP